MVDAPATHIDVKDLTISYDGKPALSNVNLDIRKNEIFGIIGPAGSGKTSFLRVLNRMDANVCLLYTSPSPRDRTRSRMPSSA